MNQSDIPPQEPDLLVVDDTPANLRLLTGFLREHGYAVRAAVNGAQALTAVERQRPDLILLDIKMPGMDGFEVCTELKNRPESRDIPVIFISALGDAGDKVRAFDSGGVDYIIKPFQQAEVLARVRTHLHLCSLQHSLLAANEQLTMLLERQRCLLDSVGEGIMGIDAEDRVTFMNPRAEALLGYAGEELQALDVHRTIHHTRLDGGRYDKEDCPIRRTAREKGTCFVGDDQFFHKERGAFRVEYTVSSLQGNFDNDEAIVVFRDITERRRIEQRLEEAATVFEVSSEGIMLTDAQGVIQRLNPAFSEITGYRAEEVVGQTPSLLKSGHHPTEFYAKMWHKLSAEGYWEGEIWNRRKDGSVYPEWQMITAVRDSQKKIVGYVSQFSDITRRKLTEEEIRYRANYDVLTGLANRTLLLERLEQSLKEHRRNELKLGLVFIDLDKFKQVNDTLGHPMGDLLLQQVAERIKTTIREIDTAARLGGDEFVVMLTDLEELVSIERIASRLLEALDSPFVLAGHEAKISASIGIAIFPEDGDNVASLLRNTDIAMYKAKEKGRNRVQFFTDAMEKVFLERSRLESDLHLALQREELEVYYQPIVDLRSGKPVGLESLLRWLHPTRGLVSPEIFIPIAEAIGMISEIGAWVIETTCRQHSLWRSKGLDLYASVNVSPFQVPSGLPVERLERVINEVKLPPDRLALEITEGVYIRDIEQVANWLRISREKGFRIYLDDFGTGYSSLSYLKQFSVDAVNIDRTFIHNIDQDESNQTLVQAIVAMSEGFKLPVIAEGIESEEQLRVVQRLGCAYGQGYLCSEPVPADQVPGIVSQRGQS